MIGKPVRGKMVKMINYNLLTFCTHSAKVLQGEFAIAMFNKFSLLQMVLVIKYQINHLEY